MTPSWTRKKKKDNQGPEARPLSKFLIFICISYVVYLLLLLYCEALVPRVPWFI